MPRGIEEAKRVVGAVTPNETTNARCQMAPDSASSFSSFVRLGLGGIGRDGSGVHRLEAAGRNAPPLDDRDAVGWWRHPLTQGTHDRRGSSGRVLDRAERCSRMMARLCRVLATTSTTLATPLSRHFSSVRRCRACRSWSLVSASMPMSWSHSSSTSQARRSPTPPTGTSVRHRSPGPIWDRRRCSRRSCAASRTGSPSG